MEKIKYYRVMRGYDEVIGAINSTNFLEYQKKHKIFLGCNEDRAQCFELNGDYYYTYWMTSIPSELAAGMESVVLTEIDKTEYDIINAALENGEDVEYTPVVEEPVFDDMDALLDEAEFNVIKAEYAKYMKDCCNAVINYGVCVGDILHGKEVRYTFKIEDQLVISALYQRSLAGPNAPLPYHHTGGACRFHTADEIYELYYLMENYIQYNLSYCNSIIEWVNAAQDVYDLDAIEYGEDIPEEYQNEVLKAMHASEFHEGFGFFWMDIEDIRNAIDEYRKK